jgi:hypothetical protein
MEHAFLRSPDHLTVDHALRRAEVIGVGGSPELAHEIILQATKRVACGGAWSSLSMPTAGRS